MKKLIAVLLLLVIASGCVMQFEPNTALFEGKERTLDDIAEILESRLQEENPQIDFDVTVSEDVDD